MESHPYKKQRGVGVLRSQLTSGAGQSPSEQQAYARLSQHIDASSSSDPYMPLDMRLLPLAGMTYSSSRVRSGEMIGVAVEGISVLLINVRGTVHAYIDACDFGRLSAADLTQPFYIRRPLCAFFETRATNSSNLESKSFRMGDSFDFL